MKLKIKKLNNIYKSLVGIAHINTTYNNTLITITNLKGRPLVFGSSGFLGLNGSARNSTYAGQSIANSLGKKLLELKIYFIQIRLKGFGNSRKSILKGFISANIKVLNIKDVTVNAHNGCRNKKIRRV
jgi:small subunit ribosomal protein S11